MLKLILIMLFAFVLAYFGATNLEPVQVNLFGYKQITIPLGMFIFIVFFLGAIFSAFLAFFDQMKRNKLIRDLKNEVAKLKQNFAERVRSEVEEIRRKAIKEELSNLSEETGEESQSVASVSESERNKEAGNIQSEPESRETPPKVGKKDILKKIMADRGD